MELNLKIEDITFTEENLTDIFEEINDMREANFDKDDPDYDYRIMFVISYAILYELESYKQYDFNIFACGKDLGSYRYMMDTWLTDLAETYRAINNKEDFEWEFFEQDYNIDFKFKYTGNSYTLAPKPVIVEIIKKDELKEIESLSPEKIDIDSLKQSIDSARVKFLDFVKANIDESNRKDIPPEYAYYIKLLDLSFSD